MKCSLLQFTRSLAYRPIGSPISSYFFLPPRASCLVPRAFFRHLLIYSSTLLLFCLSSGCQNGDPSHTYTTSSLYRTDIKTVHVPIFESQTFTRQVEFELHRCLCQRIELHSPFKVVAKADQADTILYGRISNVSEDVLNQQRQLDRPMENELTITAYVTWKDLRSGDLFIDNKEFRISSDYAALLAAGKTGAIRDLTDKLAVRIVDAMEEPW